MINHPINQLGPLGGSEVKASACNAGDLGSIPGLGRSPGEGNGNPLQYSCLENPMDGGAWWATVHEVTKSQTWLSDWLSRHAYWIWILSFFEVHHNGIVMAQRLKASACNAGDLGSILGSGRSPGEGNGNPFHYSCLENPMDGGTWWATVRGVTKSRTRLSDFTHSLTHGQCIYGHSKICRSGTVCRLLVKKAQCQLHLLEKKQN